MKQTIGFLILSLFLLVGCGDSISKIVENNQTEVLNDNNLTHDNSSNDNNLTHDNSSNDNNLTHDNSSSDNNLTDDNSSSDNNLIDDNSSNQNNSTLTGKVIDGEISGATLFLDLDKDNELDSNEPNSVTKLDGSYILILTKENREHENYLNKTAPLVVYGGKDIRTQEVFEDYLMAIREDSNLTYITPFSTLIAQTLFDEIEDTNSNKLQKINGEKNSSLNEKIALIKKNLAELFGLNETILNKDPIDLAKAGDNSLLSKSLQLHKSAKSMKKAMKKEVKKLKKSILKSYRSLARELKKLKRKALKNRDEALIEALDNSMDDSKLFDANLVKDVKKETKKLIKNINSFWQGQEGTLTDNALSNAIKEGETQLNTDTTKPIITLIGESTITLVQKTPYTDAGATAFDDIDGDISSNIQVDNHVDTNRVDTYNITYDVIDSSGNIANQVIRTVIIKAKPIIDTSDTTPPSKPTLTSTPITTTNDTQSIEVNGEVGATVWVNDVEVGTVGDNEKVTINLNTSGADGAKSFSIVLKDGSSNTSDTLFLDITKTTAIIPDTTAPSKPKLTTTPITTTNNTQSIEVNGEVGATVWINGVQKGIIGNDGKTTIDLDTSGADGEKSFSIVLKDSSGNASEALVLTITKTIDKSEHAIFISPNGDDNNDGSYDAPLKDTKKICSKGSIIDKDIYFREGVYNNFSMIQCSGTKAKKVEIKPWANEKVKFTFDGATGIRLSGNYVKFSGIEIEGVASQITYKDALSNWWRGDKKYNGSGIVLSGHHIEVSDCVVHDATGSGISAKGWSHINIHNNIVYNCDWWTIAGSKGIGVTDVNAVVGNEDNQINVKIENNLIFGVESRIFSRVWSKGFAHLDLDEGEGILVQANDGNYTGRYAIKNNFLLYTGKGVVVNRTNRVDVINNTLYGTGTTISGKFRGVRASLTQNSTFKNNAVVIKGSGHSFNMGQSSIDKVTLLNNCGNGEESLSGVTTGQNIFANPSNLDFTPQNGCQGASMGVWNALKQKADAYGLAIKPTNWIPDYVDLTKGVINHIPDGSTIDWSTWSNTEPFDLKITNIPDEGISGRPNKFRLEVVYPYILERDDLNLAYSIESQISSTNSDVEELNNGSIYTNSSDLELIQDRTYKQVVGLHFNNINIEKGMQIESAYIQFQVDEASDEETNLVIHGEKVANSIVFNTSTHNVSSRVKTDSSVAWSPAIWDNVGSRGEEQQTTDLKAIIQEIINQEDWINGNSLSLIIEGTGRRVAESYDGSVSGAPKLYITYIKDSLDSDGDGVIDREDAFPSDGNESIDTDLDGIGNNADLDDDGDGISDEEEIKNGTNPLDNNSPEIEVLTLNSQISSSADDAEEFSFHQMLLDSSDLELTYGGKDEEEQYVGMKFNNINIPVDSTIISAYIQFQTDEVSQEDANLTIHAQKVPLPANFSKDGYDISNRATTHNSVNWKPLPWSLEGERGIAQRTTNISSVISEVIEQNGWKSGNSVVIIITGTGVRVAESYDGSVSGAPKLIIRYAKGKVGQDKTPPVITLNADSKIQVEVGLFDATKGATAYDNFDGNLSITIGGDLNKSKVGTYTVTYTSTNMAGLSTTVNQEVEVIPDRYLDAIEGMLVSTKSAREKLKNYIPKENFNYGKEFFVSPTGDDSNDGTKENPWKTLKGARDGVRAYKASNTLPIGGIVVWFRAGEYQSLYRLDFEAQDSGEDGSPIAYRGYQNEKVRIMGAIPIESSWFKPVDSSDPQWDRLDSNARNHIQVLNLNEHNITNLGSLGENHYASNMPLELFDDTKSLDIARWPDREASDVIPYYTDDKVTIYGENLDPDVSGTYSKVKNLGPEDNNKDYYTYALFKKDDLVDGKQYYIKHFKAESDDVRRVWAITTGKYINEPSFWYAGTGYSIPRDFTRKTGDVSGVPTTIPFEDIQFGFASYKKALSNKSFEYVQDRPSGWKNTGDIWVNGGFQYIWRNYHIRIESIDTANKSISLEEVPGLGMNNIGEDQKRQYYVYNVIEELTAPGEYFVDKNSSNLYYYPKQDLSLSNLYASMTDYYLIDFDGASFVEFHDMAIEMSRQDIVRFTSGSHNLLSHLQLRLSGRHLVTFADDVSNSGVEYSYMSESGSTLAYLHGGDKETLTNGNNFVTNNEMVGPKRLHWSNPALSVGGVGNKVEHNDIHGFRYIAISYSGNECTIDYNNIYDVLNYAEDGGAIYSGRSWTARGNKVNYNFIHDLKNNYSQQIIVGIYFDVSVQQQDVIGNIFYNLDGKGMLQAGGRYNKIMDNLFIKVATPFMGINNAYPGASEVVQMTDNFAKYNYYKGSIWTSMYPELENLPLDIDELRGSHWLDPEGNIFKNNFGQYNLRWALNGHYQWGTKDFSVYETAEMTPMNRDKFRILPYNKIGIQLP